MNFFLFDTHTSRRVLHGLAPTERLCCARAHGLCAAMIEAPCHGGLIAAAGATGKNENKRKRHKKEKAQMLLQRKLT